MVKRKKTITKHDLKRGVIGNRQMMESLLDRITNLEYIMMYYIEMKKDQKIVDSKSSSNHFDGFL